MLHAETESSVRQFKSYHGLGDSIDDDPARLRESLPEDDMSRWRQRLEGHLELLRCYYNFVRPHRALKFGQDMRTPAMQAGLTGKRLTLRQVFCSGITLLALCRGALRVRLLRPPSFSVENGALQVA